MVLAMIRCFIEKKNRAWDRDLPLLAMALHSTVNKNIGFTANKLILGRETTQPIHLLLGLPNTSAQRREHDPWILELAENLKTVHRYARQSLKAAQMRQKRDYDMRMLEHSYNIGDLIFLRDSSTKIGLSKKLKPPWTGPYLVVESRPPLYKIKSTKSEKVVHHDRMKRCNDRHIPLWIKRMRHELFNQEIVSQEYLILETKENDQMDETLPYTEDFFNSLGLEQVDENSSLYVNVQNNSLEVITP